MRSDVIQIVKGAVDKAARQFAPRHRRHKRIRAGGQHQFVPVGFMPASGAYHPGVAIDGDNLLRQAQLNAVVGKEVAGHHRQ